MAKFAGYYLVIVFFWAVLNNLLGWLNLEVTGYDFEFFLIVGFIVFAIPFFSKKIIGVEFLKLVTSLYVGYSLVLLFVGGDHLSSIDIVKGWFGAVAPLSVLFSALIANLRKDRMNYVIVMAFLSAISTGVIIDSVLNLQIGNYIFPSDSDSVKFARGIYRASFIFDSPMATGYLMGGVFFFSVVSLLKVRSGFLLRILILALSLSSIVACVLSLSRGGYFVMCISIILYFSRRRIIYLFLLFLLLGIVLASISILSPGSVDWLFTVADFSTEGSNVKRLFTWVESVYIIKDGSFFGYGLGALRNPFVREYVVFSSASESTFLYAFIEGGVLWGVIVSSFYGFLFFTLSKKWLLFKDEFRSCDWWEELKYACVCFSLASIVYSAVFPMFVEKMTPLLMFMSIGISLRDERCEVVLND